MNQYKQTTKTESWKPTLFDNTWIDEIFKDFTQSSKNNADVFFGSRYSFPKHDVVELRKNSETIATQLRFALGGTGYDKTNVCVSVEGDKLFVSSLEKDQNKKQNEYDEVYLYNGIAKRSFKQEYSLNSTLVDTHNVTAEFKDGTLVINLPHLPVASQTGYQVEIK